MNSPHDPTDHLLWLFRMFDQLDLGSIRQAQIYLETLETMRREEAFK